MTPDDKTVINGVKIERFWWAGKYVVYVDGTATDDDYKTACRKQEEKSHESI